MEFTENITSGNKTVDRMLQLDLSLSGAGSYIPNTWYKTIHFDNGKPYTIACIILSDIVYWYKPQVICDERSGQISCIKKKFKADLLQRSYGELAEKFGISKLQATNAIIHLEKLGVIRRELRSFDVCGTKVSNVLFIDLNVDRLKEITYPKEGGVPLEMDTPTFRNGDVSIFKPRAPSTDNQTNTKNTTKITTENKSSSSSSEDEADEKAYRDIIANNIQLAELKEERPSDTERIDMLYEMICEVVNSKVAKVRINKEEISLNVVKSNYLKIGKPEILHVLDILNEPKEDNIRNLSSYLKTVLYNSIWLAKEHCKQKILNTTNSKTEPIQKSNFNCFPHREYSSEEWEELKQKLAVI